jgi:hypothetical protein
MKKKMLFAIAALMVLGLSMVVFAYTNSSVTASGPASCCKGDSCPMKSKDTSTGEKKASCCDNCNCCSGGSCPMKSKKEGSSADVKITESETSVGDTKACDCSCCKHDNKGKASAGA